MDFNWRGKSYRLLATEEWTCKGCAFGGPAGCALVNNGAEDSAPNCVDGIFVEAAKPVAPSIGLYITGITGLAGSGKDTVREMLLRARGGVGIAFADPIRWMVHPLLATLNLQQYMEKRELKEVPIPGLGVSYRRLTQTIGTEWGRKVMGENFWVLIAARRLHGFAPGQRVVISDVRFPNEADWIRASGGKLVRVARPGTAPVAEHESEEWAGRMGETLTIVNDGTLQDLEVKVAAAVKEGLL